MNPVKSLFTLAFFLYSLPLYASESGGMASTGLRAIASLVLIIALMFTLAWAFKRYGPISRVKKSFGLDILGQVNLGAKVNLALIRVGKSILLIGVTANAVSLLKDMEEGDFEKSLSQVTSQTGAHQ
ncbi:MAG: FliO/MopB family protein [Desulfomonilia bacterium]